MKSICGHHIWSYKNTYLLNVCEVVFVSYMLCSVSSLKDGILISDEQPFSNIETFLVFLGYDKTCCFLIVHVLHKTAVFLN